MPEKDILLNLFDKPEPSLCDKCKFAYCISGGSVSFVSLDNSALDNSGPLGTYRQRYCPCPPPNKSGVIASSGYQECENFDPKSPQRKYGPLEIQDEEQRKLATEGLSKLWDAMDLSSGSGILLQPAYETHCQVYRFIGKMLLGKDYPEKEILT